MRVALLMPVYNEGGILQTTLANVRSHASEEMEISVYLVDDGSREPVRVQVEAKPGFLVRLARHRLNLGQGAALETARQMALRGNHDVFITMDSDGQHNPGEISKFVAEIQSGADVVFGSRFLGIESVRMPASRRAVLHAARSFERMLTGLTLSDAHNGYRAFSHRAIEQLVLSQDRMAHATEIKQRVSRGQDLVVREIPVEVTYSSETLAKGQSSLGAVNILRDLFYAYLFGGRS